MTDTKTQTRRTHFRHPALDAMDTEKAALRTVLRALDTLGDDTLRRSVLSRALLTLDDRETEMGDPDAC